MIAGAVVTAALSPIMAWGQARIQLGSQVQDPSIYAPPPATTAQTTAPPVTFSPSPYPGQPLVAPTPSYVAPGQPTWDPYAGTTAPPASGAPYYAPPPGYGQPIAPYSQQPAALYPQGVPWGQPPGTYAYPLPDGTTATWQRFLQRVNFEYTWLAPMGGDEKFGWNSADLSLTFGFPIFYNTETPLLVTPGFTAHFLDGPVTMMMPTGGDLPPQLFDAYLDFAWRPRVTPWLSGDLGFRTGVYTDLDHIDSDSLRFMGRGLAVFTFTPTMQVAAGVVYLDRNPIKLLPSGGLIWTPNQDARYEILFPNPKLAHRLTTLGTTEWWWYVAGEYGGGSWSVERIAGDDIFDYNDIRAIVGVEWTGQSGVRGLIEVGYVFDREILYRYLPPTSFDPEDTVMVRGGLTF
jgi:hypothetical protein